MAILEDARILVDVLVVAMQKVDPQLDPAVVRASSARSCATRPQRRSLTTVSDLEIPGTVAWGRPSAR
jgi:hypothetical protein